MSTTLDERAAAASQDLRQAFEYAPIPAPPATRRNARTFAVVGALGLALGAGALAVVINRDGGENQAPANPAVTAVERHFGLELDAANGIDPTMWSVVGAGPVDAAAIDVNLSQRMTIIETPEGRIGATFEPGSRSSLGGVTTTIGDRQVYVTDGVLEWEEAGGLARVRITQDVDANALLATLIVSGDALVPTPDSGMTIAYQGDLRPYFAALTSVDGDPTEPSPGHDEAVIYGRLADLDQQNPVDATAVVGVLHNHPDAIELVRTLMVSDGSLDELTDGRNGITGSITDDLGIDMRFAAWQDGDDLVTLTTRGLDQAAFEQMLGAVTEIDDAFWRQMSIDRPLPQASTGDDTGEGSGEPPTESTVPAGLTMSVEEAGLFAASWQETYNDPALGVSLAVVETPAGFICFSPDVATNYCVPNDSTTAVALPFAELAFVVLTAGEVLGDPAASLTQWVTPSGATVAIVAREGSNAVTLATGDALAWSEPIFVASDVAVAYATPDPWELTWTASSGDEIVVSGDETGDVCATVNGADAVCQTVSMQDGVDIRSITPTLQLLVGIGTERTFAFTHPDIVGHTTLDPSADVRVAVVEVTYPQFDVGHIIARPGEIANVPDDAAWSGTFMAADGTEVDAYQATGDDFSQICVFERGAPAITSKCVAVSVPETGYGHITGAIAFAVVPEGFVTTVTTPDASMTTTVLTTTDGTEVQFYELSEVGAEIAVRRQ